MAFDPGVVNYDPFQPVVITMLKATDHGNLVVRVSVACNADGFSMQDVETAFQEILDHTVTLAGYTFNSCQREAHGYQNVTPTEA